MPPQDDRKTSSEAFPPLSTMTTTVTMPEKTAALSSTTTACTTPGDRSPRTSDAYTPGLDKHTSNPFDSDVEAGSAVADPEPATHRNPCGQKGIALSWRSDHRVWPGKAHWKQKAKTAKKNRSWCTPLAQMSRRNRIIARVLIILVFIGVAVGVGVGISKSLNAPIWNSSTRTRRDYGI